MPPLSKGNGGDLSTCENEIHPQSSIHKESKPMNEVHPQSPIPEHAVNSHV